MAHREPPSAWRASGRPSLRGRRFVLGRPACLAMSVKHQGPAAGRRPRAQSAAAIRRLPSGCTSPSCTGVVPVRTSTRWPTTSISPGPGSGLLESGPLESGSPRPGDAAGPDLVTGHSFTVAPSHVVQAPGAGVHALISRSIASAGCFQLTLASSRRSLGARLTPWPGCGLASSSPDSIPSSVATSSSAPATLSRSSRSPAVSRSLMGSVTTPNTGPASSSATSLNVVAPVTSSPCRMACATGAAPRQAGSNEKCRLTQPHRGRSSAARGIRAP